MASLPRMKRKLLLGAELRVLCLGNEISQIGDMFGGPTFSDSSWSGVLRVYACINEPGGLLPVEVRLVMDKDKCKSV